ncbi:hypothetical protein ACFW6S_01630 [Streptomyces sp. NPDC058740]|uniref:hypothetical protein n=1 Tax=Streptomyces sp. NPDC058740 TaxID=3346619 RepID=UPI003676C665
MYSTESEALSIVTRQEREAAARSWLLLSTAGVDDARHDWRSRRIALMKCDSLFCAARVDSEIVHAAAGTADLSKVMPFLALALFGGPAWMDRSGRRYYILMPPSAARRREWPIVPPRVDRLARILVVRDLVGATQYKPDSDLLLVHDTGRLWSGIATPRVALHRSRR